MCSTELAPAAWRSLGSWRGYRRCCGLWGQEHSTKPKPGFSRQGGPATERGQQHWWGTRDAEEAPHGSPAVHKEQELLWLLRRKVGPHRLLQQSRLQCYERLNVLSGSAERLDLFMRTACKKQCFRKTCWKTVGLGEHTFRVLVWMCECNSEINSSKISKFDLNFHSS